MTHQLTTFLVQHDFLLHILKQILKSETTLHSYYFDLFFICLNCYCSVVLSKLTTNKYVSTFSFFLEFIQIFDFDFRESSQKEKQTYKEKKLRR